MDVQQNQSTASPWHRRIIGVATSKITKRTIKGSLAYIIVFIIYFINPFRGIFARPLILQNLILPTIVLPPTQTVGGFLDGILIFLIATGIGGALSALVGGALASSNTGQGILLFVFTYLLSLFRSNMRFFAFGLLTVLLMFQGITSSINQAGHFDHVQLIDSLKAFCIGAGISLVLELFLFPEMAESELQETLVMSLSRLKDYIDFVLKTYRLEATEEDEKKRIQIAIAVRTDARKVHLILEQCRHEITYSRYPLKQYKDWVMSINRLQTSLVSIGSSLFHQSGQMKKSKAFTEIFLPNAKGSLVELQDAMKDGLQITINYLMKKPENKLKMSVKRQIQQNASNTPSSNVQDLEKDGISTDEINKSKFQKDLLELINLFEQKQHDLFQQLFLNEESYSKDLGEGIETPGATATTELKPINNEIDNIEMDDAIGLLNVYTFNFNVREFVEELVELQGSILSAIKKSESEGAKLHFHFNLTSYIPDFGKFWKRLNSSGRRSIGKNRRRYNQDPSNFGNTEYALDSGLQTPNETESGTHTPDVSTEKSNKNKINMTKDDALKLIKAKKLITDEKSSFTSSIRIFLSGLEHFFRGPESLFALKVALAMEILAIIAFSVPDGRMFFQKYNLQSGVVTLLVAISPTLGQAILTFILQIFGAVIGSVWALITLYTWKGVGGYEFNPYGVTFFLALVAFPVVAFQQKFPHLFVVGLLILLNCSGLIVIEYVTAGPPKSPLYVEPWLRWARITSSTLIALGIGQAFNLSPLGKNTARSQLRHEFSNIFHSMNKYYTIFIQITNRVIYLPEEEEKEILEILTKDMKRREMKLSQKLNLIQPLMKFASSEPRLRGPFPRKQYERLHINLIIVLDRFINARMALGTKGFGSNVTESILLPLEQPRKEYQTQLTSKLYMFGTALATKAPLPATIPGKVLDRNELIRSILVLAKNSQENHGDLFASDTFSHFYAYALNVRSISFLLDEIEEIIKDLFGTLD